MASSHLSATPPPRHTHDFDELFWVQRGEGRHLINEDEVTLRPGTLVTIVAADRHTLFASSPAGMSIVNIAFPVACRRDLARRYPRQMKDPWRGEPADRHRSMSGVASSLLRQYAAELLAGERSTMAMDRFLLNLCHLINSQQTAESTGLPDWLASACRHIQQPEQLRRGTRAMAELASRSPEHLSRAMRRFTGQSPTEYINTLRMSVAALRIAEGRQPIADIAADLGLSNLAHFYTLFRRRYGMTPRRYRLNEQLITGHEQ